MEKELLKLPQEVDNLEKEVAALAKSVATLQDTIGLMLQGMVSNNKTNEIQTAVLNLLHERVSKLEGKNRANLI